MKKNTNATPYGHLNQSQKNQAMEILRMQIDSKLRFFEAPSKSTESDRAKVNGNTLGFHIKGLDAEQIMSLSAHDMERIRKKQINFINDKTTQNGKT